MAQAKSKRPAKTTKTKGFAHKVAREAVSIRTAEDKLTETVRAGVAQALRKPGPLLETAAEKAREAMEATLSAGGDTLSAARSITRGVLLGISDAGGDGVSGAGKVVTQVVNSALAGGGEAVFSGWRALQGVVDAATARGANVASATQLAADFLAKSVVSAGESATGFVQRLIRTTVPQKAAPAKRGAKRKTRSVRAKTP
ncbi:MAG: hypothetical protein JNK07_17675 [Alphaproteobacteria bacterium]|nr:hypothetical protein [Alphaproteobacteria bacterium]